MEWSFAYHVFLQVLSSSTPLPNFDFTDVFQPEQAACTAPSWLIGEGIDLTGQTQLDYASISDLMSIYGNTYVPFITLVLLTGEISHPSDIDISLSYIETNLDMATPIDVSSTMETTNTEGVGVSGTMLGKRSRERYGIYRNRSAGLMTTIAVVMNCPRRGESTPQMGS